MASFQGRLQLRKQKKVQWRQIWRVGWLGYNGHFIFRQKIAHKERRVSWCIVVVQHPTLVRPQLRPLPAYGFPQMLQNCYVKLLVYCLTMWNGFMVDYNLPVKENQHHLHVGSTHSSFLWSGQSLPHPLWWMSLGFDVTAINPGFAACYNGCQEVLINADTVKQFLTDVNTVCFLVLGQHTGHEFCGAVMHVEFFCQNCLAWSKANAYIFSNLSDSQTAILENQMTNCINVNVCWRGKSSTSGSFINQVLSVLKWLYLSKHCVRLIHSSPKACWSIFHVSVAVFLSLKQNFTHTHTHTHTHIVLPSPSFSLPKKIASWSLHLFTSVAVTRLLAVTEWCSKKHCVTNDCRYSAPLATVRSVPWFRHCALSPVFYWSYLVSHF